VGFHFVAALGAWLGDRLLLGPKMLNLIRVSGDLTVRIGDAAVRLSPREGLKLAENLARKSFRRVLAEEAVKPPPVVRRSSARGRVIQ
jgi:hypothetical protein